MFFKTLFHLVLLPLKIVSKASLLEGQNHIKLGTSNSHIKLGTSKTQFFSLTLLSFHILSLALTMFYFPLLEIVQSALSKQPVAIILAGVILITMVITFHCSILYFSGPVSWYVDSFLLSFLV